MFTRWLGLGILAAALALPNAVQAAGRGGVGHGGGGFSHGSAGFAHSSVGFGRGVGGFGVSRGFGGFGVSRGFGGYGYGLGYSSLYVPYPVYSYPYNSYYSAPQYGYSDNYYSAPQIYTVPPVVAQPSYRTDSAAPETSTATPPSNGIAPVTYTANSSALMEIHVPANATVWVDGNKTGQTGTTRLYQSPTLTPGSRYVYEVRARWMDNGQVVERKREVTVQAGEKSVEDFRRVSR